VEKKQSFVASTAVAELEVFIGVARFFFVHDTKTGKNAPSEHKMYLIVMKHPKVPKIFQMTI
jgi:hypothetical protein